MKALRSQYTAAMNMLPPASHDDLTKAKDIRKAELSQPATTEN
jgi:hypothetical protein